MNASTTVKTCLLFFAYLETINKSPTRCLKISQSQFIVLLVRRSRYLCQARTHSGRMLLFYDLNFTNCLSVRHIVEKFSLMNSIDNEFQTAFQRMKNYIFALLITTILLGFAVETLAQDVRGRRDREFEHDHVAWWVCQLC